MEPDVAVDAPVPPFSSSTPPIQDVPPKEVEEVEVAPPPPDPIPKGVQKRIDRAVREKYEAQARTKMLEERLNALETQRAAPPQPAPKDEGEPTIDKFDNFDDYIRAKAEYIAARTVEKTLTDREQRQLVARESAAREASAAKWQERIASATVEMPDFEDVIASSTVPMTEPMSRAIMESDVGPRLAYYLANNADEARQIAAMSPVSTIRALGRIEERLSTQKPEVRTTDAPPPVVPVGTRSSVKKGPGQMTDTEYAKWRKSASK